MMYTTDPLKHKYEKQFKKGGKGTGKCSVVSTNYKTNLDDDCSCGRSCGGDCLCSLYMGKYEERIRS